MSAETALDKAKRQREQEKLAQAAEVEKDLDQIRAMNLETLDWDALKPHEMAQILMLIPRRGKQGTTYKLTAAQALVFALRSRQMGLSPISSEVWFNADAWATEPTVEGQRKIIANKGIDCGAPKCERIERDIPVKDWGYRCKLTYWLKDKWDTVEYDCWFSEWNMPNSPVWQSKPSHMLQVRALGRCLEMISGVGVSGMPQQDEGEETPKGTIETKATEFKAARIK